MKKTAAGMLTVMTFGATMVAAAPSATALPPTYGDGAIVARCSGKVVDSGDLTDEAGTAHPTAHWVLTRKGKDGTSYCFQIFSGTTERVGMAASITTDSGGAYERSTYDSGRTPGMLVRRAAGKAVSFSGEIDQAGMVYNVSRSGVRY